jgi:hypothetical protein
MRAPAVGDAALIRLTARRAHVRRAGDLLSGLPGKYASSGLSEGARMQAESHLKLVTPTGCARMFDVGRADLKRTAVG